MYETYETRISYGYLKTVVDRLVEPVCLIGGWAVYQHVNKNFKQATGRDYIGSISRQEIRTVSNITGFSEHEIARILLEIVR